MSTPSIFAQLPGELLCDIFEHAAAQCPSNALALSLVSSWVHALVEPLLYHTVVLPSSRSLRAFLATLATKHPSFPTHRVKNLGVFAIGPAHSIVDVVQRCRGTQSIACAFNVPACKGTPVSPADVARMHAWSRTQEQHLLGMACRDGWDAHVVGEGVTRLRVHLPASGMATMFPDPLRLQQLPMRVAEEEDNVGWARLAQLPNLTHLAIVYRPSERYDVPTVFEHLSRLVSPPSASPTTTAPQQPHPNLALILIQVVSPSTSPSPAIASLNALALSTGGAARRIVAERAPMSAAVQWEDAVRRGQTVWAGAEAVVQKRLALVGVCMP